MTDNSKMEVQQRAQENVLQELLGMPVFMQFHYLTSYPACLPNRDENGFAKTITLGGFERTRISSQSAKRHIRFAKDPYAFSEIPGYIEGWRSRNIIPQMVMSHVLEQNQPGEDEFSEETLKAVETAFMKHVYTMNAGDKEDEKKPPQIIMLGCPEVELLRDRALTICRQHPQDPKEAAKAVDTLFSKTKGEGNNFNVLLENARLPGGLIAALFGRMITADAGSNIRAAVNWSHAITVHIQESETDYFTAVDDLPEEGQTGAALLAQSELISGLFYQYCVVHVPTLLSNIEGCREEDWLKSDPTMAARVVEHLIHLIATISTAAKQGSTAPFTEAEMILVEIGNRQPRTLANAFRTPVEPQVKAAVAAMAKRMANADKKLGTAVPRRFLCIEDNPGFPGAQELNLDELAQWAGDAIRNGQVQHDAADNAAVAPNRVATPAGAAE